MPPKPITSLHEFNTIINSGKPALIDFWADWCGPCRMISPIFEKFSNLSDYAAVEFYKVNTDDHSDIAQEVGIRAMPTFMLFKEGNKVDELVGANPAGLEKLVKTAANLW